MQELIDNWTSTLLALIALGGVFWNWISHGGQKAMDALNAFKASVKESDATFERDMLAHDRRIQTLEDALRHLPDREDFHRLELAMEKLAGNVGVLTEKVTKNEIVVTRVDDYLREAGK